MKVAVILEVDDLDADPNHCTGLTEEAYESLSMSLVGFDIVDIRKATEEDS